MKLHNFFPVFFYEKIVQPLRLSKRIWAPEDWTEKGGNLFSIEAASGIWRFLLSEKKRATEVQAGHRNALLATSLIKFDRNKPSLANLSPIGTIKYASMAQMVAEDRTVENAKAANRQALTKILTPGLSYLKFKILVSRQGRWNCPQNSCFTM